MTSLESTVYRGRYNHEIPFDNLLDDDDFPEFEPFDETEVEAGPRTHGDQRVLLEVFSVDMNQGVNEPHHHTEDYDTSNLVLRRGQSFTINITFSRPPDHDDDFQLEFLIGKNPSPNKESQVTVPLGSRSSSNSFSWNGRVLEVKGAVLTVEVVPKASALVGKYRFYVAVSTGRGMKRTKRNPETDLYLLFNAWCPDDPVFMADDLERNEYVLNNYGVIFQGSVGHVSMRHWNYGHFEKGILNACIFLLDASKMPISDRGKVIKVVRKGSAMINSQDDDGVLVGNWSDDYAMGTPPNMWLGSVKILGQYANTRIPVSYAQCWVFAGVFNTFLRCLGIPARVISNFNSAHDNTGNLKTDLIFKMDGTPDRRHTKDSIWNFHCWNEVWIRRHDIQPKYGGWQVVDSTPQEQSAGYYCCGPASVAAIKEGEVCYQYDTGFVFAEVNSDVVFLKRDKYGTLNVFNVDKRRVGKLLLTKAVGSSQAVNITRNYKYEEGSPADERTMERAENFGCERDHSVTLTVNVTVDIHVEPCILGQDATVDLVFENQGREEAVVSAQLQVSVIFYTGVINTHFKDEDFSVTVPPGDKRTVTLTVRSDEYFPHLGSALSLQFAVIGVCLGQTITHIHAMTLMSPELTMELPDHLYVGQPTMVDIKFTNPFSFALKDVLLYMEGSGVTELRYRHYHEILPGGEILWREEIRPRLSGDRYLLALLYCSAIQSVWGFCHITVHH